MDKRYLHYDADTRRYMVCSDCGLREIPLHCGDTLSVFNDVTKRWKQTRIEKGKDWYLIGMNLHGTELEGLRVQF